MKNILSLFNGLGGLPLACERAGIDYSTCYYSEIDKYANKVMEKHYPDAIALGDVTKWREWDIDWSSIDLVVGGSPCQGFSFAGKQAGTKAVLNGEEILVTDRETYIDLKAKGAEFLSQSHLFWEYVLILDHIKKHNPNVKFLLENVKMKKELLQMISDALGVKDVVINSSLLSAQNRVRHYWANWEITQPQDKGILLKDILEDTTHPEFNLSNEAIAYMGRLRNGKPRWEYHKNPINGKSACLTANMFKGVPYGVLQLKNESATKQDKAYSLTASYGGAVAWNSCERKQRTMAPVCESSEENPNVYNGILYRKLTPIECERLQTIPDNWTDCVSNTQRYKMIGNGWTIDVISHILKHIK